MPQQQPQFAVQLDTEEYRIVGPAGEEGEAVEYEDIAVLVIGSAIYYAIVTSPDDDGTPIVVMRVDQVSEMPTEIEEVTFKDVGDGGPVLVTTEAEEEEEETEAEETGA